MNKYELMLIVNPTLSEEDRDESMKNLQAIFKRNKVKVVSKDVWGDKKLAYKINKSNRGFYVLFELDFDGKLIKEISKQMNLDRNIWRYMFSKIED